jgi:hypothetical protein
VLEKTLYTVSCFPRSPPLGAVGAQESGTWHVIRMLDAMTPQEFSRIAFTKRHTLSRLDVSQSGADAPRLWSTRLEA